MSVTSSAAVVRLSPSVWHVPVLGTGSVEVEIEFDESEEAQGWDDIDKCWGAVGLAAGEPYVSVVVPAGQSGDFPLPFAPGDAIEFSWPGEPDTRHVDVSIYSSGIVAVVSPAGIHAFIAVGSDLAAWQGATFGTVYSGQFVPLHNWVDGSRVDMFGMLEEQLSVAAAFASAEDMQRKVDYRPVPSWLSPQLLDLGVWSGGGEQAQLIDWGLPIYFGEV